MPITLEGFRLYNSQTLFEPKIKALVTKRIHIVNVKHIIDTWAPLKAKVVDKHDWSFEDAVCILDERIYYAKGPAYKK